MRNLCILLLLAVNFSCKAQQAVPSEDNQIKVSYKAFTRGSQVNVTVEKDSISYQEKSWERTDSIRVALSEQDLKKLNDIIKNIELARLPQLPAPSRDRQRDADWYASVEITTGDGTYQSQDFDKHKPIAVLVPLISFLEDKLDRDLGVRSSE